MVISKNSTAITSLSADIEFAPKAKINHLGLEIELNDGKWIERFRIIIAYGINYCDTQMPSCVGITFDLVGVTYEGADYTREAFNGNATLYQSSNRPESEKYIPPLGSFKANFTIELDKTAKKVVIKYGNKGYFDISKLFIDFSQLQANFFIKTQGRENSDKSVFVDNVKVNGQDFDDFSTPTLDSAKWKIGKFSYRGY